MALLHGNIPSLHCYLRREFLYDMEDHHGEYEECYAFSATSIRDWALMFTVVTVRGAQFTRIPLHAVCTKKHEVHIPLENLQLWNMFSYRFSVCRYDFLRSARARVFLKDGSMHYGSYKWTIDWFSDEPDLDTSFAEVPEGHKTGHLIELDCGCFAFQPNNRIYWSHPDWATHPFRLGEKPDYKTNSHLWRVEQNARWITEDTDRFFYDVIDSEKGPCGEESPQPPSPSRPRS